MISPFATASFVAVFLLLLFGYAGSAFYIYRRKKRDRNLEPPEKFELLRQPGEALRREMDVLWDRFTDSLLLGTALTLACFVLPLLLINQIPTANPLFLLVSGLALFVAGSLFLVRRSAAILDDYSKKKLGYLGERFIGEQLQPLIASRYTLYHDVPIKTGEWDENIDHVAIGPYGAAVIETKARSKPTDYKSGKLQVKFDGHCLDWPRFSNDTKTVKQVARYAEWLGRFIQSECGITVPVQQVIAIPGWSVKEIVLTTPRVVSGRGVSDAVLSGCRNKPEVLTQSQINMIGQKLELMCRDVIN